MGWLLPSLGGLTPVTLTRSHVKLGEPHFILLLGSFSHLLARQHLPVTNLKEIVKIRPTMLCLAPNWCSFNPLTIAKDSHAQPVNGRLHINW